jgi:hypothetical protein
VQRLPNPWSVPLVTVAVAAQLIGVDRATAYRQAAAGDLPTITMNGRKLVPTTGLYRLFGLPIPARPIAPSVTNG